MSNVEEDRIFTHEQAETLLTKQEAIKDELAGIRNTLNKHFGVEPALMLDGTPSKYYAGMQLFFEENLPDNPTKEQITAVTDLWYEKTRLPWDGYVDFYNPDLSAVATGTKGGDNAGMTAACSTNTTAGQDDYAGLPLFAPRDCNFEVDPETLEPVITAIDGICGNFERYNPEKMVGVLQQSGYLYVMNDASRFRLGYTAKFVPYTYIWPLHESVRPSNSKMRPWVVHAKYLNRTVDGKLTSYSGPIPTAYSISHNTLHTLAAATGTGWSGMCYCDWNFLWIMFMIKYASLSADGILQGCLANNYTSKAAAGETGVKRILLSSNPGYEVGMGVLVGEVNASNNVDRGSASCYNISTNAGCKITSIENVTVNGTSYVAIYVDTASTFDTTADTTCIATFHWPNGSCDNILGNDGSPGNPAGGKYAAKLQGIEYSVGGWEVLADVIAKYYKDGNDAYKMQLYFAERTAHQATDVTENYKASGVEIDQPGSSSYNYIKHMAAGRGGVLIPDVFGGSSSTYYKDAWYILAATTGIREVLCFGDLSGGAAGCGLSCAALGDGVAHAYWGIVSRPSPNGNRGGEWAAAA